MKRAIPETTREVFIEALRAWWATVLLGWVQDAVPSTPKWSSVHEAIGVVARRLGETY